MKKCPKCRGKYEDRITVCPACHLYLIDINDTSRRCKCCGRAISSDEIVCRPCMENAERQRSIIKQDIFRDPAVQSGSNMRATSSTQKCPECGNVCYNSSRQCPSCGATLKNSGRKKSGCATSIAAFFIVSLSIFGFATFMGMLFEDAPPNSGNAIITNQSSNKIPTTKRASNVTKKEPEIEYITCDIKEMYETLNANAMRAESIYQDMFVQITGAIDVIDSDGEYFTIRSPDERYSWDTIHCSFENNAQRDIFMDKNVGDIVVVYGKITSIGEILGYSLSIDSLS